MPDAQKIDSLIAEYSSLDHTRDAARMRQILEGHPGSRSLGDAKEVGSDE
jgi:hypothetical protein